MCVLAALDRTVTVCNSHHAQGAQPSSKGAHNGHPDQPLASIGRTGALQGLCHYYATMVSRSRHASRSAFARAFVRGALLRHRVEAISRGRAHLQADPGW